MSAAILTSPVCLSQYLRMRFGRGMQLLGSVQFLVATVRHLCFSSLAFISVLIVMFITLIFDVEVVPRNVYKQKKGYL